MKTQNIVLGKSKSSFLFIGKPGTGKTLAGASFRELGPMEFLDFDDRMQPVKLFYPELDIDYDKFNVGNLEDFAYKFMPDLLKRCDYKVVQLAGLTSLTVTAVTYQMHQKRGGDNLKKTKGGLMVPSWDEFNGEAMIVSQVLDMMKALPATIIMEAHPVARSKMGGDGTSYSSLTAFGPKVESLVPGYFNEIYYFTTETDMQGVTKYVCRTKPNEEYPLAKTSLPLPSKFVLSNEEGKPISLYKLIQEELNKHNISLGG